MPFRLAAEFGGRIRDANGIKPGPRWRQRSCQGAGLSRLLGAGGGEFGSWLGLSAGDEAVDAECSGSSEKQAGNVCNRFCVLGDLGAVTEGEFKEHDEHDGQEDLKWLCQEGEQDERYDEGDELSGYVHLAQGEHALGPPLIHSWGLLDCIVVVGGFGCVLRHSGVCLGASATALKASRVVERRTRLQGDKLSEFIAYAPYASDRLRVSSCAEKHQWRGSAQAC
jgi:hypothetical protein